jgi:hypothetical protein
VAFAHIGTGSKTWGHSPIPPYYLEDALDGLTQLGNNDALLAAFCGSIFFVCMANFSGISMTKELSATTRMVLDSFRTVFVWAISLALQLQHFHFLQV